MADDAPAAAGPPRLAWLDDEKLLELAAHDLNNMAHAAISYLDLALDPKLDAAARERFLRLAREIIRRASLFSPNLLAMVRARQAPLADEPSRPLGEELDAALETHHSRFPEGGLQVARTGDAWDARVLGGSFVSTVLYHLIDNGQRFRPRDAQARVSVDAKAADGAVRVTVQDAGKGFAPGQEKYAAARFSEPGRVSGAGVGLATVRLVVEGAGGTLQLSNAEDPKGARVVLTLPRAP